MRTSTVIAMLLASCGEHTDDSMPLGDHLADSATHAQDIRTLVEQHGEAVAGAADLSAVLALETQHHTEMGGQYEHLGEEITSMGGCMDSDDLPPDTAHMHGIHEDLMDEGDSHGTAMEVAADLQGAMDEEARHQAATADLLAQFEADLDALEDTADHFECHHDDASH